MSLELDWLDEQYRAAEKTFSGENPGKIRPQPQTQTWLELILGGGLAARVIIATCSLFGVRV